MKKFVFVTIVSLITLFLLLRLGKTNLKTSQDVRVKTELIVPKNDVFQLFYMTHDDDRYTEENSIKKKIIGSEKPQSVIFDLPDNVEYTGIRLDLGQNRQQGLVKINAIGIEINPKILGFFSLKNDFTSNEFVKQDNINFEPFTNNGKYDPYILSNNNFKKIYSNLLSKQEKVNSKASIVIALIFSIALFLFLLNLNYKSSFIKNSNLAYICVFVTMIFTPLFINLTGIKAESENLEKRKLAEKPAFSLEKDYSANFESYYNDHFGLRNIMVELSSSLKLYAFNTSPKIDKVQLGKDSFLFYNDTDEHIYRSYSHGDTMTQEQLEKKYNRLKKQKTFLQQKNIDFILAIFPNKSAIYSENLPFTMNSQISSKPSLAEQYANFFKNKDIKIYNVKEDLLKQKKTHLLYQKFDSHWNSFGAYYAYASLLNEYASILQTKPYLLSDFNITYETTTKGDLSQMIGLLQVKDYEDLLPIFQFKDKNSKFELTESEKGKVKKTLNPHAPSKKKLVVFRDSFTTLLIQFLSLNFEEVIYIAGDFDEKRIEAESPDVVMVLKVERLIKFF